MPGQNLTRAEAIERAATVTTHAYAIDLDLSGDGPTFRSTTRARFSATPGAATFIDLIAPAVHSITLNGQDLDPAQVFSDSRIQLADLAADNELTVVADCAYMHTGEGLHRFVDPVDGQTYLYTQFEVPDSRRVFAVFEQPDLKAVFTFTVTAPQHWEVVSNSEVAEVRPGAQGTSQWRFHPTAVLSSYVTAVIAGPYTGGAGTIRSIDGRDLPARVLCRASLAEHLDTENILEITQQGFTFYENAFGRPYPFTKYDQIFVPDFNAGAMENAGAVTFLERYVFRSKVPLALVERRAITILHELAHMWFGDLVTMRWWNDLWLNESFAEYASTLSAAEATRYTNAWTTFNSLEKSWAYRQDQLPSTHPIVATINDLEDVQVNFDGITYAKGASVLRQLVAWVGTEEFLTGVASYFRKHAWGNTELSDLLVELEAASGRELTTWSRLWLETAGVNTLTPQVTTDADGVITNLAVHQSAPAQWPTLRPHRLGIGFYDLVDGRLERTARVEVDVDGEVTQVDALVGRKRPALVLLNDGDLAYAKIRLDPDSLRTALAHLRDFTDSLPRALVWSAAWDMTRDGEWPARSFVDLVLGNIDSETDSTVVMMLLRQLLTTTSSYLDPAHRAEATAAAAERLWELLGQVEAGGDAQLQLLKTYAQLARTPQQLTRLQQLLEDELSVPGLTVDVDLRWELLAGLAAAGRLESVAALDAQLELDNTATGGQAWQLARAALPSTAAKERVWQAVVDQATLPNSAQTAAIAGFTRSHDDAVLLPFAQRYFAELESVWAAQTNEMAQNIVIGLYPAQLADIDASHGVDVLALTEEFLDQLGERTPALRRLVVEAADGVRRALAVQQVDRDSRS